MALGTFISVITTGCALLAAWCYVRWPQAAPGTLARVMLHAILGFAALQAGARALGFLIGLSEALAPLAVLGIVVPALTYAFLAALWFMRLFAGMLKGV